MSELSTYLTAQKKLFLVRAKETGGRAKGFRSHVGKLYTEDPKFFDKLVFDALMEATTKKWEQQPRRHGGDDLFAINGYTIPEYLTRPASVMFDDDGDDDEAGETEDEEEQFEKVDHQFATVNDLYADATIKLRKAAQSGAAAEAEMKAADDARRRARGNLAAYLRDLADAADNEAAA